MLLLITDNGTASILSGDLTEDNMEDFDAGTLDVFDLSTPLTRLTPDLEWEIVDEA